MSSTRIVDLRSDTVTRPTAAMRRAMAEAEVGDDVYGEDPTVRRLEERTAELLGQPAGLFVASGTQGNQIAVGVHCRQGDELIAEAGSHCLHYEGGAVSALWGVQPTGLPGEAGLLTPEQVAQAVRAPGDHAPRSRLLWLENTHNRGGGTVWPIDRFRAVVAQGRAAGLAVHLDGARLFNAQAATGTPVGDYGREVDTVTVCFSKGLGAPVGSVLCGNLERIAAARRLRKRLGGGMRQAGILAAGALHALDHHVARLADDHANARRLAEGLLALPGVRVDLARVQTNLIFADLPVPASEAVPRLRDAGVLLNAEGQGPNRVRLVTHLDVSREDVELALRRFQNVLGG
jgi:threonine aldolase